MLKKILSKKDCAECRFCCIFDQSDCWEIPLMCVETKEFLMNKDPLIAFENIDNAFRLKPHFDESGLYYCDALGKTGCILPDDLKPFDCKIWPFRVMYYKNEVVLALSDGCNTINDLSDDSINDFVMSGFGSKVLRYSKQHPEIVKPYVEGYRMFNISE